MKWNAALFIILSSQAAMAADIYRCEVNGKVEFSQLPCSDDAQKLELKDNPNKITPHYRESQPIDTSAPAEEASATTQESTTNYLERKRAERRIYSIKREIKSLEKDRRRIFSDRDAKIADIKSQQKHANNNLAGATWQQSLAQEMTSVSQAADSQVSSIDRQIQMLTSELTGLEQKLK